MDALSGVIKHKIKILAYLHHKFAILHSNKKTRPFWQEEKAIYHEKATLKFSALSDSTTTVTRLSSS
jgi:hypothetical protein